jgi:tetratricopeptide (TPR) repeat protein
VALQFAYEVKETRPDWSIFWVPAVSMESFEQACVGIVQALRIPQRSNEEEDPKELVKEYLSSSQARRWLLVVDNADDPDMLFGSGQSLGIEDYLPESEDGLTVYTTRTLEVAVLLTHGDVLKLDAMDRRDATDFLSRSLVQKQLLTDQATTDRLLDELTCLPLAIAQAAAYLNMNRVTVARYLWLLHNTEQDLVGLMSEDFRDDTRYKGSANAVATTWAVSFSQIRKHNAVAANLLELISCIEWKAIPRSLLLSAESEAWMEEAIGTLCGYSLMARLESDKQDSKKISTGEEWYEMHRLVHFATQVWVDEYGDAAEVLKKAIRHMAKVFPSDDYVNRAMWRAYLPHALRLLRAKDAPDTKEESGLCLLVGRCLLVDGRVQEAIKWLELSCRWFDRFQNGEPAQFLSQRTLAVAYRVDGQAKKATKLLEALAEKQEEILLSDHPDRLASQRELAIAYQAGGQVKEAKDLLENVVKTQEALAADHPSRLASQHALAMAYQANGQIRKAVELLEAVVKMRAKVLQSDHPDRLASQHALAVAYEADGQVKMAVELLEAVVKVRVKVLQSDHPDRLASQHALAVAYEADGQVKMAVELLEAVVEAKKTLAADHPSRLASQHALAVAYEADRQEQKATLLFNDVRLARTHSSETFPLDHDSQRGSHKAWQITQEESSVRSATLVEDQDGFTAEKSSATDVMEPEREGDDDCMSMESNDEDIASQAATRRSVPEILAVRQFGSFFAELEDLRSLHKEALSRLGTTRFQENYRRIFKRYVLKLQENARIPVEKDIVLILRSRTNRLSMAQRILNLIRAEDEGSSKPLEGLIRQPVEKLQLEDWAENVYMPQNPESLDAIEIDAEGSEHSVEESDDEVCAEERRFPNITQANRFLRTSFPFQMLVQDLRLLVLPPSIREVLEHTPKDSIRLFCENDTSLENKFKAFVEDSSNIEWDWWPLTPRVPHLPADKVHLRWTVSVLFALIAR